MIINPILNNEWMKNRGLSGEEDVSDEWRTNTQVKGNQLVECDIKATRVVVNRARKT